MNTRAFTGSPYEAQFGFARAVREGNRIIVAGTAPAATAGTASAATTPAVPTPLRPATSADTQPRPAEAATELSEN